MSSLKLIIAVDISLAWGQCYKEWYFLGDFQTLCHVLFPSKLSHTFAFFPPTIFSEGLASTKFCLYALMGVWALLCIVHKTIFLKATVFFPTHQIWKYVIICMIALVLTSMTMWSNKKSNCIASFLACVNLYGLLRSNVLQNRPKFWLFSFLPITWKSS